MIRLIAVVALVAACSKDEAPKPAAKPPNPFETFGETSPKVGEIAPAFALADTTGATVKLSDATAAGPVVLVSGSFSCPLFRMKTPGFEALATRWAGVATVLFVYSEEAHPRAAASGRLNGFAAQVKALDKDGDGSVTVAEYGAFGPRYMFDAFDVDHDGVIRSHEIIAARRIDQFAQIDAPHTLDERIALAKKFRAEVPGSIRVLIDPLANPTTKTYGELPNFAYVIGADGRVVFKEGWAAVKDVERELQKLTGQHPTVTTAPDLSLLDPALHSGKPVLVELTAPGCAACERTAQTLADPDVVKAMSRFEVVKLGVDQDPAWRLLEDLDLAATPAFVTFDATGKLAERRQGEQSKDELMRLLAPG